MFGLFGKSKKRKEQKKIKEEIVSFVSIYIHDNVNNNFLYNHTKNTFIWFVIESSSGIYNFLYSFMNPKLIAIMFFSTFIENEKKYGKDDIKVFRISYLIEVVIKMSKDLKEQNIILSTKESEYHNSIEKNYDIDNYEKFDFMSVCFEEWFGILKKEASKYHNQLFISEKGLSYFDFIEIDNFQLAYKDAINPYILAKVFADNLGDDFSMVDDMMKDYKKCNGL